MVESHWHQVIEGALRTPSPENTQDWKFVVDGPSLLICWDIHRQRHLMDIHNTAAVLTLGCLIEALSLSASKFASDIQISSLPLEFEGSGLVAKLDLLMGKQNKFFYLREEMNSRRTYRGAMDFVAMSEEKIAVLKDLASFSGVDLHYDQGLSKSNASTIADLDASLWSYPRFIQDVLSNIYFFRKSWILAARGLYYQELNSSRFENISLFLSKVFPWISKLSSLGFAPLIVRRRTYQLMAQSQALLFGVSTARSEDLLNTGRAAFRVWLQLQKWGIGVQPMTSATLQAYELRINKLPKFITNRHQELCRQALEMYINDYKTEYPTWFFRLGQIPESANLCTSLRFKKTVHPIEGRPLANAVPFISPHFSTFSHSILKVPLVIRDHDGARKNPRLSKPRATQSS